MKMSTGNTLRIITGALLLIALMSVTAFAAVGQPSPAEDMVSPTAAEKKITVPNITVTGTVSEITYNKGFFITNENSKTMVLKTFINRL